MLKEMFSYNTTIKDKKFNEMYDFICSDLKIKNIENFTMHTIIIDNNNFDFFIDLLTKKNIQNFIENLNLKVNYNINHIKDIKVLNINQNDKFLSKTIDFIINILLKSTSLTKNEIIDIFLQDIIFIFKQISKNMIFTNENMILTANKILSIINQQRINSIIDLNLEKFRISATYQFNKIQKNYNKKITIEIINPEIINKEEEKKIFIFSNFDRKNLNKLILLDNECNQSYLYNSNEKIEKELYNKIEFYKVINKISDNIKNNFEDNINFISKANNGFIRYHYKFNLINANRIIDEESKIKYLQWAKDGHYYVKINNNDVVIDNQYKWNTLEEAKKAAKKWIKNKG